MKFFAALSDAFKKMFSIILSNRRLLASITRVELAKRHAGSILGMLWVVLQPALLLSVYLFVYMVVFPNRMKAFGQWDFVLYVFCGLVPYLGFMEALTTGGLSIKQNIHLVKNVMLPIELIPVRAVLVGMASQFVSIGIVLLMAGTSGIVSANVVWLPVIVLLQMMWLVGLTWILSSVTVALPDVTYFVNLFVFLLAFVSPIGFRPDDLLATGFHWMLYVNPVFYLTAVYRGSILHANRPSLAIIAAYVVMCLATFAVGGAFFERFKGVLTDYE
jgi:lipopolysaccharide transport system permease protein